MECQKCPTQRRNGGTMHFEITVYTHSALSATPQDLAFHFKVLAGPTPSGPPYRPSAYFCFYFQILTHPTLSILQLVITSTSRAGVWGAGKEQQCGRARGLRGCLWLCGGEKNNYCLSTLQPRIQYFILKRITVNRKDPGIRNVISNPVLSLSDLTTARK